MNLVSAERIGKRYASRQVLADVSFGVDEGDRVGIIGRNGSGKSTLLRLLAGTEQPDEGQVVHARRLVVAFVGQGAELSADSRLMDAVVGGGQAARALLRFEQATTALREQPEDPSVQDALAAATRTMDAVAGWDLEHVARGRLDRLGLPDMNARIGDLSGGQQRRAALARGLVQADLAARTGDGVPLLVLDEPTNHLDVDIIEWLEGELRGLAGALLIVTHDRYLLDRVSTRIVEVYDTTIATHYGSYSDYLEERSRRVEVVRAAEHKRRQRAKVELDWLRRSPAARTSKSKSRVEKATAIVDAEPTPEQAELVLDLPARRIGSSVVRLHNVGAAYGELQVLEGVTYEFKPGERVGIVGPNGSGKTTLLRLIAERREPDEGSVRTGTTVFRGWFGQEPEPLPPRTRVVDAVKEVVLETNTVDGITLSATQLLERFMFDKSVQGALVSELSGGERRRLELLRVLATAPNLLLLDEPTNDLDLDTLAVLEEYLERWPGTMVVASHDRFFLDRVCTSLFSIEPDGSARHHPGGWTAYRQWESDRDRREAAAVGAAMAGARGGGPDQGRSSTAASGRSGGKPRKLGYNERRELGQLERRIEKLEQRKAELTQAVQESGSDYAAALESGEALSETTTELEEAESRWLELQMMVE